MTHYALFINGVLFEGEQMMSVFECHPKDVSLMKLAVRMYQEYKAINPELIHTAKLRAYTARAVVALLVKKGNWYTFSPSEVMAHMPKILGAESTMLHLLYKDGYLSSLDEIGRLTVTTQFIEFCCRTALKRAC